MFTTHLFTLDFLHRSQVTSDYIKTKHIFLRTKLPRGRFVLVPTTFKPGEHSEFLLRVFADSNPDLRLLEQDKPEPRWYNQCCASPPTLVTRVVVKKAQGLENSDTFGSEFEIHACNLW